MGKAVVSDCGGADMAHLDGLDVVPEGRSWAVKHKGAYLGFVSTEAEAWAIVQALASGPFAEKSSSGRSSTMQDGGTDNHGFRRRRRIREPSAADPPRPDGRTAF